MTLHEKLARKSSAAPGTEKQTRLNFVSVSVWSAAKISLLLGLSVSVVTTLGTLVLWLVLNQTGAFDQLDGLLSGLSPGSQTASSVKTIFGLGPVLGISIAISLVGAIGGAGLGAIIAILYNVSVKVTGGLFIGFTNRS